MLERSGRLWSRGPLDELRPLASVTKLLSALALLVACEEGTVGLDEAVGPPGATLRHLLAHASGCSPDDPERVQAPPGTRRIYSNAGFELAADHLAARSGIGFGRYLEEAVLVPLGMEQTRLQGSPAHGGMSCLGDLLRLASELLAPEARLVAPETLASARSVAFPGLAGVLPGFGWQDPCDWGLGFELADAKSPHWTGSRRSPETFGHFGQSGSFLFVDPVNGIACAALCERRFGAWAARAWPAFADDLYAELAGRPAPGAPDTGE